MSYCDAIDVTQECQTAKKIMEMTKKGTNDV